MAHVREGNAADFFNSLFYLNMSTSGVLAEKYHFSLSDSLKVQRITPRRLRHPSRLWKNGPEYLINTHYSSAK